MSFEKIAATYVYCMDYHGGQWSREYRILSKISTQYKLWLSDNMIDEMRESPVYLNLVDKYQKNW